MRSLNKAYFVCLAAAIVAAGCANSEELSGRRPVEAKNIGGTSYASDAANEANLFGEEGAGLSSNPASKPSSALLGDYVDGLGPILIDVQPTDAEMFVNSVMEFEIQVTKDLEDENASSYRDPLNKAQLVIVLESGDKDANASLAFTDGTDGTLVEEYSSKLVIHPNTDGKAKFRVSSGTVYNAKKPMYYINIWSANADGYGTVKLFVKAPPKKEDYDKYDGSEVHNELSQPSDMKSDATAAEMSALLGTKQQLFVEETKQLGVQVNIIPLGATGADAEKYVVGAGEAVCWNFVKGDATESEKLGFAVDSSSKEATSGCDVADPNGRVYITVNTGKYYSAQYYLNFYHALTAPVTYDITTFVMPNTLGTEGESLGADLDGDGKPDEGLALDVTAKGCKDDKTGKVVYAKDGECPKGSSPATLDATDIIDSGTGKGPSGNPEIDPETTQKLFEEIAGGIIVDPETGMPQTDIKDGKLNEIVTDNCYVPDATGTFVCTLEKDSNGNWQLWTTSYCTDPKTGAVTQILSDPTADCSNNADGEPCEKHPATPVMDDVDGDGIDDTIAITTIKECDDSGENCTTNYTGIDTDGDGNVDILPDPCTADPKAKGCSHIVEDCKGKTTGDCSPEEILTEICIENPKAASCEAAEKACEKDPKSEACDAAEAIDKAQDTLKACLADLKSEACQNGDPKVRACVEKPEAAGCEKYIKYKLLCLNSNTKKYTSSCPAVETKIDEEFDTGIKYVFIDGDDNDANDVGVADRNVDWTLVRGFGSQNNASIVGGKDEDGKSVLKGENAKNTDEDGLASATLNSGTAHSVAYSLRVEGNDTHPIFQTIRVNYSVDIPVSEGDSPSLVDLEKAEKNPPADMPATDTSVGWVELAAEGAESFTTTVVKTLYLKTKVNKIDKDGPTGTTFKDTKVYWKFLKGASTSNNATLKYNVVASDDAGIAQNEFYSGTGYDATYYAIAFHPNFVERDDSGKPKTDEKGNVKYKHLTYTVRVENFAGPSGGLDVDGSGVDNTCEEEYDGIDHMDEKTGSIHQWGTKCIYACKVNSIVVGYMTEAACRDKYGDKADVNTDEGGGEGGGSTIDSSEMDPKLPKGLCQIEEGQIASKCNICAESDDDDKCPDECKPYFGGDVPGCLYLSIEGDAVREAEINSAVKLRALMKKYDGAEVKAVSGTNVNWTLIKGENSNAALAMLKQNVEKGIADNKLSTGSATGRAVVQVSSPNAFTCDSNGANCKTDVKSVTVNISNSILDEGENSPLNKLNVHVELDASVDTTTFDEGKISSVEYYVASADAHNCDPDFPKLDKKGRQSAFAELTKDRNEKQTASEAYSAEDELKALHSFSIEDPREKQLVYAIATDTSGSTVAYACEEGMAFKAKSALPSVCAECKATCSEGKSTDECDCEEYTESCTNTIDVALKLNEVPVEVAPQYLTRTLFDLGAVVAKGKDESECDLTSNNCSTVVRYLRVVTDAYQKYLGTEEAKSVGETLVSRMMDYLLPTDSNTNGAIACARLLCGDTSGLDLTMKVCTTGEDKEEKLKNCSCYCGKAAYYSKYYKVNLPIVGEVAVGEKIRPLAEKALASLVNNVLGTDDLTMDQLICSVFDAVQFVEFTGTVDLAKDSGKSTYSGKFIYSGIVPPKVFGVELDSKLSVIKGTWQEASIINDKDLFAFKTMQLNFSYGNLIYDILSKFIVKSEDGDLLNFINCESIFSSGISVPIIGGFEAKDLQSICNSFKSTLSGQAVDLADSQNVSLNIKVDGQATLEGESENIGGKIYAQNLVKGKWDGTGVVKGENYNISGLWYGSRSEDNLGELSYDLSDEAEATDLDSWKAARSICRSSIDASRKGDALNKAEHITNQLCLGGTFDVAGRDANNLCSYKQCQGNASIVVCSGESLNPEFAATDKDTIIAAAKKNCYTEAVANENTTAKTNCNNNPEVTGYDQSATNAICYNDIDEKTNARCGGNVAACADYENNTTLVVCGDKAKCKGDSYSEECVKLEASTNCKGKCDSDLNCKGNVGEAIICGERTERTLATWTNFSNGQSTNPYYNASTGKMTHQDQFRNDVVYGMYPDYPSKYNALILSDVAKNDIKIITGTDGKLGAIGIAKLGTNSIQIKFVTDRKEIINSPSADTDYYCSKYNLLFSIMGGGRKLKIEWGDGGTKTITTKDSFQVYGPSSKDKRAFYDGDTVKITLADPNSESEGMGMLRIDDIKLTAQCINGYEKYVERSNEGGSTGGSTGGSDSGSGDSGSGDSGSGDSGSGDSGEGGSDGGKT